MAEKQLAEVLLMEGDGIVRTDRWVGAGDEFSTDGYLSGQTDDRGADVRGDEVGYGVVDVAWVGGVEGAEDKEDLSCPMRRSVEEGCTRHVEGVFERWVALWFILGRGALGWADLS